VKVNTADISARRLTGMGAMATLALATLVFGCMLTATAGPREALYTRTRALHQALTSIPALSQSITVTTTWSQLSHVIAGDSAAAQGAGLPSAHSQSAAASFSKGLLTNATSQLNGAFKHVVVDLSPDSADWLSMTTAEQDVDSTLSGTHGHAVQMEVSYRLPVRSYVRVVAGSLSAPASAASRQVPGFFPTINVAVTQQTADKFGLRVGSAVQTAGPGISQSGTASLITLRVRAIVAESQPASSFWQADPFLAEPKLNTPVTSPPYWTSGALALPDESAAVQQDYGPTSLNMQWVLPINVAAVQGDQAQALDAGLTRIVTGFPLLNGPAGDLGQVATVGTGVQPVLESFIYNAAASDALLWLLYVSLAVIGAIVLLLAARMVVLRRATELALRRARGATLLQIGLAAGRGAAIGCVPAAALAGALAVLLIPAQAPLGGWWPGLAVLVIAVGAPAVLGAWRQRSPRTGRGRATGGYARPGQTGLSQPSLGYGGLGYRRRGLRRFRGGVRLVAEVTAVLAAIAGLIVFRQQGTQPGSAVNLYTSAAPVLVAVPAVIVVQWIYPLILRGLLRGAARRRGATGFLGLARAARAALTPALPAYALVLAITVAAFAGMVRDAVPRGEIDSSWQSAGADVTINNVDLGGTIPVAAQHAFAAVPGVEQAAVVSEWTQAEPDGDFVTALAVDPASYSALVASSPTWPAVDPRLLTADRVLASPQALEDLGGGKTLTLNFGTESIRVRVAGTLSGTPALPAGGPFILMPESLLAHLPYVVPNLMLLDGPHIDIGKLTALATKIVPPSATVTFRSQLLAQLTSVTSASAQHSALLLFPLALAVAAGLGLAVMLLQLALGAADREATLAWLATMGFGGRRRARLVMLEVLPVVIAAAVAAVASALVLPRIVAPAISLSVFTGSSASVPLVPDVASIALPIAGLIVLAATALTIEITARRSVVSTLRGGE
jgi:putative ABC transport system permease protein